MNIKLLNSIVLAVATGLCVAGCDVRVAPPTAEVAVSSAPPPPPAEVDIQSPAPGPDFVWIGGVWVWGPGGWGWERGHWDRAPFRGAVWVPHHYEYRGGRHVFVRRGWR